MGFYFLLELNKYHVKKEMQSDPGKKSSNFCLLQLTNPDGDPAFKRMDTKEIRYKGCMYDVIKEVKKDNFTFFYCLKDTNENNLLAAMGKVANDKYFLSFWGFMITITLPDAAEDLAISAPTEIIFHHFKSPLFSKHISTWCPPPEIA